MNKSENILNTAFQKSPIVDHLTVPIGVFECALQIRKVDQLRLLLFTKFHTPGYFVYTTGVKHYISERLSICDKTTDSHLGWLFRSKWCSLDIRKNTYHIRSWSWFNENHSFSSNISAPIEYEYILDKGVFKAFSIASILSSLINWREVVRRKSGHVKGSHNIDPGPYQDFHSIPFGDYQYNGLSNSLIAEILSVSETTARNYKHLAEEHGFIKTKPKFGRITDNKKDYKTLIKGYPELIGKVFPKDGKVLKQLPDEIIPGVSLKQKTM